MRFEKGVDRTSPHLAQVRYDELLTYFIPQTKKEKETVITSSHTPTVIRLSQAFLVAKIGCLIPEKDVIGILTRLGFSLDCADDIYTITVPSWRDTGDISITVDIIEEIARHFGYENIASEALPGPLSTARVHGHDAVTQSITQFF